MDVSQLLLTSDVGLLSFRQLNKRLKYLQQFANALAEAREGASHLAFEMTQQRVF
jgi:hypothetical protein